jgi:N-acetyl-gamma-glutamyl-phosphate reductase
MKIGIVGASGYSGGELIRILSSHPKFDIEYIAASSQAGEPITSVHPHLVSFSDQLFEETTIARMSECELLFFALPHGASADYISQLPAGIKVIDLGADFRLESAEQWQKYYGGDYAGALPYAMPELPGARVKIAESHRVANPGCYATSIALGSLPAVSHGLIDVHDIVVVAASGTTGAGRAAKINLINSEISSSLTSYKFGGVHQHTPEIEQALSAVAGESVKISFTPILAPMPRGILATITAKLKNSIDTKRAHEIYSEAYSGEEFVHVLPLGQMPQTAAVTGSNAVQMQVAVDDHTQRLIISVAIDNLGKGAASQAIQNANIMCGYLENLGLSVQGVR